MRLSDDIADSLDAYAAAEERQLSAARRRLAYLNSLEYGDPENDYDEAAELEEFLND